MMGLGWINHTHPKPFVNQTRRQTHPIRPCRFHHDQDMGGFIIRGLERVHKTIKPLWRLVNLKRPTGFSPWTLCRDLCCRGGDINANEKLIRSG